MTRWLEVAIMDDKLVHTLQLFIVLATAVCLIIFAHQYIDPLAVFTSMISGIGGIVGARIASNGYTKKHKTKKAPTSVSAPSVVVNTTTTAPPTT